MAGQKKLEAHATIPQNKADNPVLVVILDGWGEAETGEYNAISQADTPFMDSLRTSKPKRWRTIAAHGKHVGLNESDMGNSEVGRCLRARSNLSCAEVQPFYSRGKSFRRFRVGTRGMPLPPKGQLTVGTSLGLKNGKIDTQHSQAIVQRFRPTRVACLAPAHHWAH